MSLSELLSVCTFDDKYLTYSIQFLSRDRKETFSSNNGENDDEIKELKNIMKTLKDTVGCTEQLDVDQINVEILGSCSDPEKQCVPKQCSKVKEQLCTDVKWKQPLKTYGLHDQLTMQQILDQPEVALCPVASCVNSIPERIRGYESYLNYLDNSFIYSPIILAVIMFIAYFIPLWPLQFIVVNVIMLLQSFVIILCCAILHIWFSICMNEKGPFLHPYVTLIQRRKELYKCSEKIGKKMGQQIKDLTIPGVKEIDEAVVSIEGQYPGLVKSYSKPNIDPVCN